ncbi:hypothetical protein DFH07DRAFT_1065029 [Mycena maculata]|uniref:F-box domain-containing protein n=1 Tax=Mycena maculata TaxID=230809 RepID=A0AAD7I6T7_9AGAR|nr:hypothetical protein DFH07DRAFT_1065029 [Mycena maculata]
MHFLALPPELILACLADLNFAALDACLETGNRLLNEIIFNSVLLRYRKELERACVEENPSRSPKPSVAERLRELRDRDANWLNFTPTSRRTVTLDFRTTGIYDLANDFYLVGDTPDPITMLCTGIKYIRTARGSEWRRIDAGKPIVDFGLALEEHDLIAIVTYDNAQMRSLDIMLLKFSTGEPHPRAAKPTLHVQDVEIHRGRPGISIEIVGENIAFSVLYWADEQRDRDTFHLFNWKSGAGKMTPFPLNNTGLTFLTPEILIVPSSVDNSLDVFRIPPSVDSQLPSFLHSFGLPELEPAHAILTFQCRGEPNPRSMSTCPSRAKFLPQPDNAIVLFSFQLGRVAQADVTHHMFVLDRARFTRVLDDCDSDAGDIPWAEWGPQCARWLDADPISMHYITTTCGQRMVTIADGARTRPAPIYVLDFNPAHVRRQRAAGPVDGVRVVEADEEPGQRRGPFMEPIHSLVPYVETVSKGLFDYGAVLINEEHIIGAKFGDRSVESLEFLHFG